MVVKVMNRLKRQQAAGAAAPRRADRGRGPARAKSATCSPSNSLIGVVDRTIARSMRRPWSPGAVGLGRGVRLAVSKVAPDAVRQIWSPRLRAEARDAPESGIVEVFNYGRGREGLIPLWVGEGDLPTPGLHLRRGGARRSAPARPSTPTSAACPNSARRSPAITRASTAGRSTPERFFVTGGGMQAIQIAVRMVAGVGDEVLVPTPAWPNIAAAIGIGGATRRSRCRCASAMPAGRSTSTACSTAVDAADHGDLPQFAVQPDRLDRDARRASRDPRFRPRSAACGSSPTRSITASSMPATASPSFYDIAEPDERILYVNTFSKNWAMTGWRIGWLSAPPALGQTIENLIQYSTSGVAAFLQRAATAALDDGDDFLALAGRARPRRPRDRRARASQRPAASASPSRPARSTCSSPSTARPTRRSARPPPGRRGQRRPRAGQRLRRRRRRLHAPLLRPRRRPDARGDRRLAAWLGESVSRQRPGATEPAGAGDRRRPRRRVS